MYKKNCLYLVGSPIGNIFDFSQRAIIILKKADIIASEDTRKTEIILRFLKIKNKIISLNKHNEIFITEKIKKYLDLGKNIAIISDSGTPIINDPGYFLTTIMNKNNIKIKVIPGTSALTTSIIISQINMNEFNFYGFMNKNEIIKKQMLRKIKKYKNTSIIFESAKRIKKTLYTIKKTIGLNSNIIVLKNISKPFEKITKINSKYLVLFLNKKINIKGEFIIMIENKKIYKYKKLYSLIKKFNIKNKI